MDTFLIETLKESVISEQRSRSLLYKGARDKANKLQAHCCGPSAVQDDAGGAGATAGVGKEERATGRAADGFPDGPAHGQLPMCASPVCEDDAAYVPFLN